MLLIVDTCVSEGELISCQEVCILCVQHVMNCISTMILSLMFVFMVLIMYVPRILCVILLYFMDYHLSSIVMSF